MYSLRAAYPSDSFYVNNIERVCVGGQKKCKMNMEKRNCGNVREGAVTE